MNKKNMSSTITLKDKVVAHHISDGSELVLDDLNYTCPCCSYTLLRHVHLGRFYWRCSHCYQDMPAL